MASPPDNDRPSVGVFPFGDGLMVRLSSAWPIFARALPSDGGWSVALVALRFDARPQPVAESLPSRDDAVAAATVALTAVEAMQEQDAYRYRLATRGPNRWYVDGTARRPKAWTGDAPALDWPAGTLSRAAAARLVGYLDATFPGLVNLAQHRPHFDARRGRTTDPNEHAVEVLGLLDTSGMGERERLVARVAVLYHDVGKGVDSYDPRHPVESARLAEPLVARHGLDPDEAGAALLHVREHDLLGVLSRGRMTEAEAIERLRLDTSPRNLDLHFAIATADITAIRGLRWVVDTGLIREARERLARALCRGGGTLGREAHADPPG